MRVFRVFSAPAFFDIKQRSVGLAGGHWQIEVCTTEQGVGKGGGLAALKARSQELNAPATAASVKLRQHTGRHTHASHARARSSWLACIVPCM